MSPEDRVNFLADSWAMVQAGRAEPSSYLALVDDARRRRPPRGLGPGDQQPSPRSTACRATAPSGRRCEAYARAKLRPVFDRLGWDGSGSGDDDDTLLRAQPDLRRSAISATRDIIAEAKRRFAGFLQDPKSLPPALRDSVTHVVGVSARPRRL